MIGSGTPPEILINKELQQIKSELVDLAVSLELAAEEHQERHNELMQKLYKNRMALNSLINDLDLRTI